MYRDVKSQGLQCMILFIELFANVKRFAFLDLPLAMWVIKWDEKDEKVFKQSISTGWLHVFYGISTFVGYFTPNPFLYK